MPKKRLLKGKGDNNSNAAVTIAIIGLAGTVVTSLFAYLTVRAQIELPSQLRQTGQTQLYQSTLESDASSAALLPSTPATLDEAEGSPKEAVRLTLENKSQYPMFITIIGNNGVTMSIVIPPETSQTIAPPPGEYTVEYYIRTDAQSSLTNSLLSNTDSLIRPPSQRAYIDLTEAQAICFTGSGVLLCNRLPVFLLVTGLATIDLILLIAVQVQKLRARRTYIAGSLISL